MKRCPMCKKTKPSSDFGAHGGRRDGLTAYCTECFRAYRRAWRYGVSLEEFLARLETQGGTCAVEGCAAVPTDVDHDHSCCPGAHSCGKCVRGLLCRKHNSAIGFCDDNPASLHAAAAYIETHRALV